VVVVVLVVGEAVSAKESQCLVPNDGVAWRDVTVA